MKEKIVIVSGIYDPLSFHDVCFFHVCKSYGDWLIVGLHSDANLEKYHSGYTQSFEERKRTIESVSYVDEIFAFKDADGTAKNLIKNVMKCYPDAEIFYFSEHDMMDSKESKIRGVTFVQIVED